MVSDATARTLHFCSDMVLITHTWVAFPRLHSTFTVYHIFSTCYKWLLGRSGSGKPNSGSARLGKVLEFL